MAYDNKDLDKIKKGLQATQIVLPVDLQDRYLLVASHKVGDHNPAQT